MGVGIDALHIKLVYKSKWAYTQVDYSCRHAAHTVLIQEICDHAKKKIRYVSACTWRHSWHNKFEDILYLLKLTENTILQEPRMLIQRRDLKPYIVQDSTYPLLQQYLRAYNVQRSNRGDEDEFNQCLRRGNNKIENIFRIYKNWWTMLRALNCDVKHARTITIACCMLHNFCNRNNDKILVNPAFNYTDDMSNDNDVHPAIQTKYLLKATSLRACTLNKSALF